MKKHLFISLLCMGVGGHIACAAAVVPKAVMYEKAKSKKAEKNSKPLIKVQEDTFVDKHGRQVIFHGLNIMNKGGQQIAGLPQQNPEKGYQWFSNFYVKPIGSRFTLGEQWAQFFVENGFNGARVGIFWNSVEPSPGVYDDNYIRKIVDMVRMFGKYHIYCVLDFHQDVWYWGDAPNMYGAGYSGMPQWAVEQAILDGPPPVDWVYSEQIRPMWEKFWYNLPAPGDTVGLQDRYLKMYKHVLSFFKNEPYLVSYSDINEKNPDNATMDCYNQNFSPPTTLVEHCSEFYNNQYAKFKEKLSKIIRKSNKDAMIQNDLTSLELDGNYAVISKPKMCNTVVGTSGYFATTQFEKDVQNYASNVADANKSGFLITEYGAGLDNDNQIPDILDYFDSQQRSNFFWNFSESQIIPTGGSHHILKDTALPPIGENIDAALLTVLSRPYPKAVAGTIIKYNYTGTCDNTFNLTYSTSGVNGCKMSQDVLTEIYIPKRNYPNGYIVELFGYGTVVSKPNAQVLLIRRNHDAEFVTVKVTGPSSGIFLGPTFNGFGTYYPDPVYGVANPSPDVVNPSPRVLKFLKGGWDESGYSEVWAGAYAKPITIDLVNKTTVTLQAYFTEPGDYLLKFEDPTTGDTRTWEQLQNVPVANQWVTLSYDLTVPDAAGSGLVASGLTFQTLTIFPYFGTTQATDRIGYTDNIISQPGDTLILDFDTYPYESCPT